MITYDVWKLIVDIALCLSLLVLAFRFFRTGHLHAQSRKGMELEAALRKVIQDAKEAGTDLNDELYRRQLALEKALSSIDDAEVKIRNVSQLADERCRAIDQVLSRTQGVMEELKQAPREEHFAARPAASSDPVLRHVSREYVADEELVPSIEMQSPRRQAQQAPAKSAQRAYSASQRPVPRPQANSEDAYGAWLEERVDASASRANASKLRSSIEREIDTTPVKSRNSQEYAASSGQALQNRLQAALMANKQHNSPGGQKVVEDMESIYQLAENLLRAGHEVDAVVMQTKLPERRVQALFQMVERERAYGFAEDEKATQKQPIAGLGALSAAKRGVDSI